MLVAEFVGLTLETRWELLRARSRRDHAESIPGIGLPKHSVNLSGAEDLLEDVSIGGSAAIVLT